MLRPTLIALLSTALLLIPDQINAREFRVDQVPNGSRFSCSLCHLSANGGGPRNGFGSQVENSLIGDTTSTAQVDWSAIYDLDGDSDGYSNGRELNDPDGMWTIGAGNPGGDTFAPYDRTDSPCGDGVLENPPEECDGDQLPPDVTCEMFGWGPGTLTCASTCRINQEQCQGYEVVIPNSNNPPPTNNSNPPANNSTNNDTGETTGPMTTGMENDDEDEGGCSTTGGTPTWWVLVVMMIGAARNVFRRR